MFDTLILITFTLCTLYDSETSQYSMMISLDVYFNFGFGMKFALKHHTNCAWCVLYIQIELYNKCLSFGNAISGMCFRGICYFGRAVIRIPFSDNE